MNYLASHHLGLNFKRVGPSVRKVLGSLVGGFPLVLGVSLAIRALANYFGISERILTFA